MIFTTAQRHTYLLPMEGGRSAANGAIAFHGGLLAKGGPSFPMPSRRINTLPVIPRPFFDHAPGLLRAACVEPRMRTLSAFRRQAAGVSLTVQMQPDRGEHGVPACRQPSAPAILAAVESRLPNDMPGWFVGHGGRVARGSLRWCVYLLCQLCHRPCKTWSFRALLHRQTP